MMKSAHPDIALWSYEHASRGYFGYHLRAGSRQSREKLRQKLLVLTPKEPLLLRFGAELEDPISAGWARTDYTYLAVTRGAVPTDAEGISIAIPDESWSLFLALLEQVAPQDEDSVNVITPNGHVPLWLWWDVA